MKIIKRGAKHILIEEAHGGSGLRKVYVDESMSAGNSLEAVTHGFLQAGKEFDWHEHADIEEVMIVLSGSGIVCDDDGEYDYKDGDVFIFPANTQHKIHNTSDCENEMIFVRVRV